MLPNIGATKSISHTLVRHLGDDVVGELDSALDIMHLTLFSEQGHLHHSRYHLVAIRFLRLGSLKLSSEFQESHDPRC